MTPTGKMQISLISSTSSQPQLPASLSLCQVLLGSIYRGMPSPHQDWHPRGRHIPPAHLKAVRFFHQKLKGRGKLVDSVSNVRPQRTVLIKSYT